MEIYSSTGKRSLPEHKIAVATSKKRESIILKICQSAPFYFSSFMDIPFELNRADVGI